MQKVVTINVLCRCGKNNHYRELQFPQLQEYLDDGYKVVSVHQIASNGDIYVITQTFVLEK